MSDFINGAGKTVNLPDDAGPNPEVTKVEVKDVERKEIIKNELEIEDIIADENLCSNLQFVKIPGSNNDWRSGQPSLGELKYIIQTFNIKNVIRMNGDSESDSSQKCGKGKNQKRISTKCKRTINRSC